MGPPLPPSSPKHLPALAPSFLHLLSFSLYLPALALGTGPKKIGELSKEEATGCALLKGEADPKILPDSEYPAWLFKLLEPAPTANELQQKYDGAGLTLQQVRNCLPDA